MKKRIISIVLAAMLFAGSFLAPISANAASIADSGVIATSSSTASIAGGNVVVSATLGSIPASDDGIAYLYELKTYEYGIPAGRQPVATTGLSKQLNVGIPLGASLDGVPRLYNKFVYAVKRGGTMALITNAQYISNPEAVATNPRPRQPRPVKGKQRDCVINMPLTGNGLAPRLGIQHMVLVCYDPNCPAADLGARGGDSHPVRRNTVTTYMPNAENDAGIMALVNDCVAVARDSGAQDFVIGNEVNERCWNYTAWCDWDTFVRKYVQVFRVCYTAIKSTNPNAMVYTSLDQVWNRAGGKDYEYLDGSIFLSKFNQMMVQNGNTDWNLSIHPYPNPLYYPKFWDMSGVAGGATYKAEVDNNRVITFQNLSTVTNVLCSAGYRNRSGGVRDVIIGEIGMGTNAGVDAQAAGVCASYAAMERNPYVTQYLYLEYDVNGFFPTLQGRGLEAYNAMGTPQEQKYMDWAKSYIGISDWGQVLR